MIKFVDTLLYYDEPMLCTLKDEATGQNYLAMAIPEDDDKRTMYSVIRVSEFDLTNLGDITDPRGKSYQALSPKKLRALYLRENERGWFKCHLCDEDIKLIPQTVPMIEDYLPLE